MTVSLIGFITDCEGNFDYWCKCVKLSRVVAFKSEACEELQFSRLDKLDRFVFGGDVFDKGPGDIRIARALANFKRRHPDRVWLLAGNRDLNKLRFPAELDEDLIDVPQPVPVYPRAPPQVDFRTFLERQVQGKEAIIEGCDVSGLNTKANRLRWILEHTMTAGTTFELRRQELALLRGSEILSVHDDEVVKSFLDSVLLQDGFVWNYLSECSLLVVLDDTLFVHAGIPQAAPGWTPSLDMRYLTPSEGARCGGVQLPEGHSLHDWVDAMNSFLKAGLQDFRSQTLWRSDRTRGGEALHCLTSSPACFKRSVVVESLLQAGMPVAPCKDVESYLACGGIKRMLCGHKPCGDSPFIVKGEHIEYVHCDTTYSDAAAKDRRGSVAAAVEVELSEGVAGSKSSKLCLSGSLRDGRTYDFCLPAAGFKGDAVDDGDQLVGRQTSDGWWVKAKFADGSYHVAWGDGGRTVTYATRTLEELLKSLPPC